MNWNPIYWSLSGVMLPFLKALVKSKGNPTYEFQRVLGIYGYLVLCGVIFNCVMVIVFIAEAML